MKLNPNLEDWWTNKGQTALGLHDDSFGGAGVSVKVILEVFDNDDKIVFFSLLGGAHKDDLYVIGVEEDSELLKGVKKEEYKNEEAPIRNWYGEEMRITEFKINQNLKNQLGIIKEEDFLTLNNSNIKYRFYFHDNFIFSICPIDEVLLLKILTKIKQLHNFYIDDFITNKKFETIVFEELRKRGNITIESQKKEKRTKLVFMEDSKSWFKKVFKIKEKKAMLLFEK